MGLILIVDDQIEACRPLAVLMRHMGHRGDYATSGEAALDYLAKQRPDLLILDVMMPGMDGMEVLRRVRSDPRHAALPVVMFSAVADPVFREHALAKGANDYWVKASMDFAQLSERVEPFLKKEDDGGESTS